MVHSQVGSYGPGEAGAGIQWFSFETTALMDYAVVFLAIGSLLAAVFALVKTGKYADKQDVAKFAKTVDGLRMEFLETKTQASTASIVTAEIALAVKTIQRLIDVRARFLEISEYLGARLVAAQKMRSECPEKLKPDELLFLKEYDAIANALRARECELLLVLGESGHVPVHLLRKLEQAFGDVDSIEFLEDFAAIVSLEGNSEEIVRAVHAAIALIQVRLSVLPDVDQSALGRKTVLQRAFSMFNLVPKEP